MPSYKNLADVFQGGATTSQHVEARDDKHFADTTFLLKRTRSLGLLDDFIIPGDDKVKDDFISDETVNKINQHQKSNSNVSILGKQVELKHRLPKINTSITKQPSPQKQNSIIYNSDSSSSEDEDEDLPNKNYLPHDDDSRLLTSNTIERSSSHSPTPTLIMTPEFLPHDDNDLLYEPQRHVDYLSHDWQESDISKSWRYIVNKRKDVANSARLENASWRTWAQLKNHLKTVSPESVNWLKESDVTWLYGPLYKEPHDPYEDVEEKRKDSSKSVSPESGKKITENSTVEIKGLKPILKKRTAAEMMLSQLEFMKLSLMQNHHKEWNPHSGSPILEAIHHHHNSPPTLRHGHHDPIRVASPVSVNSPLVKTSSNLVDQSTDSILTSHVSSLDVNTKKDRQIHFNDTVEQCIAVDIISDDESDEGDNYDDDDSESSDDSDDEGGFCLHVKSPSSAFLYEQGNMAHYRQNPTSVETAKPNKSKDTVSVKGKEYHQIIAKLPSTHLNYHSTDDEMSGTEEESDEEDEENKYTSIPFYDNRVSHNVHTSRNYDYHYNYDYNSIYPNNNNNNNNNNNSNNESKSAETKQAQSIINNEQNDELEVFDLPENLDLGSIMQVEDINDNNMIPKPTRQQSNNSLRKSSSGYNIKQQEPLPPFQSNTSVKGQNTFTLDQNEESDDENKDGGLRRSSSGSSINVNKRLQRISSGEGFNNNNQNTNSNNDLYNSQNGTTQYSKLSSKTKDIANLFLGNWKK